MIKSLKLNTGHLANFTHTLHSTNTLLVRRCQQYYNKHGHKNHPLPITNCTTRLIYIKSEPTSKIAQKVFKTNSKSFD